MILRSTWCVLALAVALSGCSATAPELPAPVAMASITGAEALRRPERVVPGRLEYAPDGSTFAPILTERFAYPTQSDANGAYLRLISAPGLQAYGRIAGAKEAPAPGARVRRS